MNEQEVLQRIRERLTKLFDVHRIVLFGSRARGDAKEDSDYDVLVIADTHLPFIERQGRAREEVGRIGAALDLLVYTPEEAARAAAVPGTALYWAEREGSIIYAK
jgi:uncharacterized protein